MTEKTVTEIVKVANYDNGQSWEESLWSLYRLKLRGLTVPELDERLVKSDKWKEEKELYPLWSGTFSAYEAPDVEFKDKIEFMDYTVIVPKEFQGKENMALLCNFPDFSLQGKTITSDCFKAVPIPSKDGWYLPDSAFGFPTGKKVSEDNPDARHLWRRSSSFVGLLSRWDGRFGYYGRRVVYAGYRPYGRHGVAGVPCEKTMKHAHEWTCICGEKKQ